MLANREESIYGFAIAIRHERRFETKHLPKFFQAFLYSVAVVAVCCRETTLQTISNKVKTNESIHNLADFLNTRFLLCERKEWLMQ
jgi:hypothetical protein